MRQILVAGKLQCKHKKPPLFFSVARLCVQLKQHKACVQLKHHKACVQSVEATQREERDPTQEGKQTAEASVLSYTQTQKHLSKTALLVLTKDNTTAAAAAAATAAATAAAAAPGLH